MFRFTRRSLLWLLPVIIIPVAVLVVLQFKFLRKLERTTASAEHAWLRSSLEEMTHEMETYYRTSAERTFDIASGDLTNCCAVGKHFRNTPLAGAKTLFAMRFDHKDPKLTFFDRQGKEKEPTPHERQAVKLASVSWQVMHKFATAVKKPELVVDERDRWNRVIAKVITDDERQVAGLVGAVLDEREARAALLGIGRNVAHRRGRAHVELRLGEPARFARRVDGERPFTTQAMGFIFTGWRLGVRDCLTPEEIAADNFRINGLWTGSAMLVLMIAVVLAFQATARQMRLSQMKSDFVSNVSHELRTPLSSIRVFGEYMRLGRVTAPEKIREYGEYIETESRRLTSLINNILDFSRIESGDRKYRFAETDIVGLLAETVHAFASPLREHGFSIRFVPPSRTIPPLAVDKDAIAQAVVNLMDNGIKYSAARKEIDVVVHESAGGVRIDVRDYGIGIPSCEQKKIFEKFYRVGSGLVHDVKGSGLGLSIVNHIVRAHRGEIVVTSVPGEGSTFTIVLPAETQERAEVAADVTARPMEQA